MNRVSKLTRKFIISLSAVFAVVVVLSLMLNKYFTQRYFVYQEKQEMRRICDYLESGVKPLEEMIRETEEKEDVVIAWVPGTTDNELLNERLRAAFLDKGISLKKYWLWDQDQQDAMEDGRKMRIYHQNKLHYSLMVVYLPIDGDFLAVSRIIPSIDRTLSLISQVTIAVFAGAMAVMFLLITVLVRRITAPLKAIGETAKAISELEFKTVEVCTGDELEKLAEDINHMSRNLKEAHQSLEQKNRQMKELLANVSHDLKTPVSLIKAYTRGMKDGLDDGSFLDTVILQNERMEQMIERLLDLAKMEKMETAGETVDISRCLAEQIEDYRFYGNECQAYFECDVKEGLTVVGNREAVSKIITNLLSNAVKYTADKRISVSLYKLDNHVELRIENRVNDAGMIDTGRIWEPFAVAEESRNKDMSGTGLGLAIVKAAALQNGYGYGCRLEGDRIIFYIIFR